MRYDPAIPYDVDAAWEEAREAWMTPEQIEAEKQLQALERWLREPQ